MRRQSIQHQRMRPRTRIPIRLRRNKRTLRGRKLVRLKQLLAIRQQPRPRLIRSINIPLLQLRRKRQHRHRRKRRVLPNRNNMGRLSANMFGNRAMPPTTTRHLRIRLRNRIHPMDTRPKLPRHNRRNRMLRKNQIRRIQILFRHRQHQNLLKKKVFFNHQDQYHYSPNTSKDQNYKAS